MFISQVGSEGGGELLAPWLGATALIIQLPPLPGWLREQIPRPGRAAGSLSLYGKLCWWIRFQCLRWVLEHWFQGAGWVRALLGSAPAASGGGSPETGPPLVSCFLPVFHLELCDFSFIYLLMSAALTPRA